MGFNSAFKGLSAIFTRMQEGVFSLNMWGRLKFTHEALNWTLQSQTKACITKSSCEICAVVRYYAVETGNSVPMFRQNLSVPSSRAKKSKRENRAWLRFTDTVFFLGTLSIIQFFKETQRFERWLHFCSQGTKHLTWWTPRLSYS